jgi:serine/threonine protein kinase
VFLCKGIGSPQLAVKCISATVEKEREFGYISQLNSIFVVKYLDFFTIDAGCCFVMDYFENGSVGDLIKDYQKQNKRIERYVCSCIFIFIYVFKDC